MKSKTTFDTRWRPLPPYDPTEYRIVVTPDVGKWCEAFMGEKVARLETADAATLQQGHRFVLVFQLSRLVHGTIGHECFHLTTRLLQGRLGMPLTEETEEAFAYLLGWLIGEVGRWAEENSVDVKNSC